MSGRYTSSLSCELNEIMIANHDERENDLPDGARKVLSANQVEGDGNPVNPLSG
jgi:hypothetical protein